MTSRCCNSCKKSGDTAASIRLKACSACSTIVYCSPDCQKADWKRHKAVCQFVEECPPDSTEITIEHERDVDALIAYAIDYMPNVEHAKFDIPDDESFLDDDDEVENVRGSGEYVRISASKLTEFLSKQTNLKTLDFGICAVGGVEPWPRTKTFTDCGRIFLPLANHACLQKLVIKDLDGQRAQNLVDSFPPSLKVLKLENIKLDGDDEKGSIKWPDGEKRILLKGIANLASLVKLELSGAFLEDSDLEGLLSGLKNLKNLAIHPRTWGGGYQKSFLTDKGFATIARLCPNLQYLCLSYHEPATKQGVKTILQSCKHLRELEVLKIGALEPEDLKELLPLSTTLLSFEYRDYDENVPQHHRDDEKAAIIGTGGRVVISECEIEAEDLPAACQEQWSRSQKLIDETEDLNEEPGNINEWERLYDGP